MPLLSPALVDMETVESEWHSLIVELYGIARNRRCGPHQKTTPPTARVKYVKDLKISLYSLGRILNIRLPSVRESLIKGILLLRVSPWDVVIIT